jgi:hypothetical protein
MSPNKCGAGAPARERLEAKSKPAALLPRLVRAFGIMVAALREIFDESAYQRFLARHRIPSTAAAYSEFCRDHECIKARRPRCC